jgi:LysM repeat protein
MNESRPGSLHEPHRRALTHGGPLVRWLVAALASLLLPTPAAAATVTHTVAPGETLGHIARRYGVSVENLRRWNRLRGDMIREGQQIRVETRGRGRSTGRRAATGGSQPAASATSTSGQVRDTYVVRSGDTGLSIARRGGFSIQDLRRWNRGTNLDRLRIGQKLIIYVDAGPAGARGTPNRGRLTGGVTLRDGAGFNVRNPARAFGTEATVAAIQWGLSRLAARFPDAPAMTVGDLSLPTGGRMPPHKSHQNGLDADICILSTDATRNCIWRAIGADELDVPRTWYLFKSWMDQGYVEYIFIDRKLQAPLYEYARSRGATEAQLARWFEYPRRGGSSALIRHEPGHDDHFHIRFVQR